MLGASESESLCGNIIENLEEKYGWRHERKEAVGVYLVGKGIIFA